MAECRAVFKILLLLLLLLIIITILIIILIIITTTTVIIILIIIVKVIIIILIIIMIQGIYQAPTLLLKAPSNTNRQYILMYIEIDYSSHTRLITVF